MNNTTILNKITLSPCSTLFIFATCLVASSKMAKATEASYEIKFKHIMKIQTFPNNKNHENSKVIQKTRNNDSIVRKLQTQTKLYSSSKKKTSIQKKLSSETRQEKKTLHTFRKMFILQTRHRHNEQKHHHPKPPHKSVTTKQTPSLTNTPQ